MSAAEIEHRFIEILLAPGLPDPPAMTMQELGIFAAGVSRMVSAPEEVAAFDLLRDDPRARAVFPAIFRILDMAYRYGYRRFADDVQQERIGL